MGNLKHENPSRWRRRGTCTRQESFERKLRVGTS